MENQISDIPQVSQEENNVLVSEFPEAEVREAVFQMEHNKARVLMVSQQNFTKFSRD
jgi:hypothetical protein